MKIYIDDRVCNVCGLFVHFCPRDVLRLSDRRNQRAYTVAEAVDAAECVGCKL